MIFGAETPEVLEAKIKTLDEQIEESEHTVCTLKDDLGYVKWRDFAIKEN